MRLIWCLPLIAFASCATTPREPEIVIRPQVEPNPFDVQESAKESEERRYSVNGEEFASNADASPRHHFQDRVPPTDDRDAAMAMHIAIIVRRMIEPGSWIGDPRRTVFVEKNQLVVRHTPETLEQIDRLLLTLKANRNRLLRFTMRGIPLPADGGVKIESLEKTEGGLAGVFDRGDLLRLLGAAFPPHQPYQGQLPTVSVFPGQSSQLLTRDSFPYIEGLRRSADGWVPQIALLETGSTIDVRGIPLGPESETVLIEVFARVRSLRTMHLLKFAAGTIQLPEVTESVASGLFVVKPGQALLLLPPPGAGTSGAPTALMVEPELVKLDD